MTEGFALAGGWLLYGLGVAYLAWRLLRRPS